MFYSTFEQRGRRCQQRPFLVDRLENAAVSYSWGESLDRVEAIAASLSVLIKGRGKHISILAENCAHWVMTDLGILRAGHVGAPLFTTMTPEVFSHIIDFADVDVLFVGRAKNWTQVRHLVPARVRVIAMPGVDLAAADFSFDEFLALGKDQDLPDHPGIDGPCSLIFTSGTSGFPKAVIHSQRSFYHGAEIFSRIAGQKKGEGRFICHLPLAHIGEKVLTVIHAILVGATITFIRSPESFVDDLRAVRPTMLLSVPRIWEKLLQGVIAGFGIEPDELGKRLLGEGGEELAARIRQSVGVDQTNFFVTAGSLVAAATIDWYRMLGIDLRDIFGQTEVLPITCSTGGQSIPGSVGPAAPGFEIRVDSNDEVLVRGPGMALGYYRDPAKTAETFVDGWVRTGDKGRLDEHGNLFLTGRTQDTFKGTKGKFVAPGPIEDRFSENTLTAQHCLHGLGLTQPIMLCTLSTLAQGKDDEDIQNRLIEFSQCLNSALEPHERIGGIIVSRTEWSTEAGLLTHTLKVRREQVQKQYRQSILSMAEEMTRSGQGIQFTWA